MRQEVVLAHPADFAGWRCAARDYLRAGIPPGRDLWRLPGEEGDLFAAQEAPPGRPVGTPRVPKAFIDLAETAICHADDERFSLLYRILWRLQSAPRLLADASDPDIHRLTRMAKAVRRDMHKMKAFVRFREMGEETPPAYAAWFEPHHHIVEKTAPFFVRRFTGMRWSILTPGASAHWNGTDLIFGAGAARGDVPSGDALDEYWRTYYAHIFNPARLKPAAMQREMPKKYWRNLPEAPLIRSLIESAGARTEQMVAAAPTAPRRGAAMTSDRSSEPDDLENLEALAARAKSCTRCPLYRDATQLVWGEGPANAALMLVGEQPGDQEDLEGRPFVGPAGQVLDKALADAGVERDRVYVTNAVKHFKFTPRGKRRIHQKPNVGEIEACRWWFEREVALVKPEIIVALGATAARAVLGKPVTISRVRGDLIAVGDRAKVAVTVHPSYLLRLPDEAAKAHAYQAFVADLADVRAALSATAA